MVGRQLRLGSTNRPSSPSRHFMYTYTGMLEHQEHEAPEHDIRSAPAIVQHREERQQRDADCTTATANRARSVNSRYICAAAEYARLTAWAAVASSRMQRTDPRETLGNTSMSPVNSNGFTTNQRLQKVRPDTLK